jgi:hypothetical protein
MPLSYRKVIEQTKKPPHSTENSAKGGVSNVYRRIILTHVFPQLHKIVALTTPHSGIKVFILYYYYRL